MTDRSRALESRAAQEAFDRLSLSYDAIADGEIFKLLRERTHLVFARTFHTGCRVIEIGCGTGLDTEFLARRGVRVLACDPAEGMVCRTTKRLAQHDVVGRATVLACGLDELVPYLDALHDEPQFDGIVSNFGALNCVGDLRSLGALVARHLRPGASLILGLIGRSCAWEAAYFALTMRPALIGRRRGASPVAVPVAGIAVPTFYHRVCDVRRTLGAGVTLTAISGVGVMIPPPYLEPRWQRAPGFVKRICVTGDRLLAPWPPFNRLGDHTLVQFTKARGGDA